MFVSEEQVAVLEAEVAGLLGILELLDENGAIEGTAVTPGRWNALA